MRYLTRGSTFILVAFLALLLVACAPAVTERAIESSELVQNADGYTDVDAEQLAQLLEGGDLTLVNVHIPYAGEIPDTDLFIPFDEISDYLDELPATDEPIVLYCRSGGMSTAAAKELAAASYTNILELDGGMRAWKAAGYELIDKND